MKHAIYQVDAFTSKPFGGNPAAVCLLSARESDDWMQNCATEMNLSETAFVEPIDDSFSLRWFTPTVEVSLCGHATLASAHVLWEENLVAKTLQIQFQTKSGQVHASKEDDWICLDFPAITMVEMAVPQSLEVALGERICRTHQSDLYCLCEVDSEQTVRNIAPDFAALKEAKHGGVIVTAAGDSEDVDFVSRFFAPDLGIDEDPVTGSAHSCLTPFWAKRLGKSEMLAHQLSRRGGILKVRDRGQRVDILGQAVTVVKGKLFAP